MKRIYTLDSSLLSSRSFTIARTLARFDTADSPDPGRYRVLLLEPTRKIGYSMCLYTVPPARCDSRQCAFALNSLQQDGRQYRSSYMAPPIGPIDRPPRARDHAGRTANSAGTSVHPKMCIRSGVHYWNCTDSGLAPTRNKITSSFLQ